MIRGVCDYCPQLVIFKDPHGCQETHCRAGKDWRLCQEDWERMSDEERQEALNGRYRFAR